MWPILDVSPARSIDKHGIIMRRLLTILIALASLGLLALLLFARLGSWAPRWWLDSLDTFALYAFLPFVGTLVFAFVLRSRLVTISSVAALFRFASCAVAAGFFSFFSTRGAADATGVAG